LPSGLAYLLLVVLAVLLLGAIGALVKVRRASRPSAHGDEADADAVSRARDDATSRARAEDLADERDRAHAAAQSELDGLRAELRELRLDLERREERLATRESRLDSEVDRIGAREHALATAEADLTARQADVAEQEERRLDVLERAAGLSRDEAKAELTSALEAQTKRAAAAQLRAIERDATDEAERRARQVVTMAVQRVASDQTAESVVTVFHLPADEMKGRIIGREGRNIRAFEAVTGVNLIIDDTPEAVLLSCFDPVRREVGRLTLESLVLDGRIHPQRIEEVYERSRSEIDRIGLRAAEDALVEVGITDIDPELVRTLGRLRYRTSYGQNVLAHLIETAHLAGAMAAELGLDIPLMKRCGFLHDIGKALTHEVEGSHAIVGAELARRYGESADVVHAIEAHHNEVEVRTLEAVLTQAADAISGSRPGARRESLESYVKRLHRLEQIASEHEGVDRVFAMQAGREVRVMVLPDLVDDIGAQILARDIAKRVEEELTYPGQIRITVVRESRASELAR